MIVSQNIYAATMEKIEEFATLKALGATRWYVIRIVWVQALICGVSGSAAGLLLSYPLLRAARDRFRGFTQRGGSRPLSQPAR